MKRKKAAVEQSFLIEIDFFEVAFAYGDGFFGLFGFVSDSNRIKVVPVVDLVAVIVDVLFELFDDFFKRNDPETRLINDKFCLIQRL